MWRIMTRQQPFWFFRLEILFNIDSNAIEGDMGDRNYPWINEMHSYIVTFTCSFTAQEDTSDCLCITCRACWHSLNCNYGPKSALCFALANWPCHSIIALSCSQALLNWKLCFVLLFFFPPPLSPAPALFGPTLVHIGSSVCWPCICFTTNLTTCRWRNPCQGGLGKFWCVESSAGALLIKSTGK